MTLYHGLSPNSVRNDEPTISDLTNVSKFIIDGSYDMCNANIDLQTLVDVSKKMDSNRMSIKRSKRLPKTFMIIKLSPLSKLISKRYRYSTKRHGCIILFQGVVKKKKVNVIVFFPYKSKAEKVLNEIKIGRYLSSIASTNVEKISKSFQAHIYYVPIKVQNQLRNNTSIKNRLIKPIIDCDTKSTSRTTPISETYILNEFKSSSNPANNSFTKVRPNVNLLKRENSLFPLTGNEQFYLVKRIHRIYIMSKTKKCTHYPTCSKKYCRNISHSVSNIFEQSCKLHDDILKKTVMPCGGHHKDMNNVMERLKMKSRCIERDYEHMLHQISKLMHTCNSDKPKLRETSKVYFSKEPQPMKEIMPHCRNCTQKEKSENNYEPNCMNDIGRKIKSTLDWCSKQAKTKLKNNNIGKIIKNTCGMCSRPAKTKLKSNHLDKTIKSLYGQCTQQSSSELKTTLKTTKQDCYMFSVHGLPNQKLVCESERCHFKENVVLRFWSIMNLEQTKVVNCAAISKRDSNTVNYTSKCVMKQRNCLKSKLLLLKKTSEVFFDVSNFAEYDICLQGMFKDPSKCSSPKSISFNIPEDHESSHSSLESSLSQHSCCCLDMDESKCILRDNSDSELSKECKNKLCNAKTSPIKVKLPLPKCIDCTRDHKQCDMGLNALKQNIEGEYKPIMSRKKPRIIRRQKIPPSFPPECIIEIDDTGKVLKSLELIDRGQQKNKKCKQKIKNNFHRPFWLKLFQKIIKKRKRSKKKPSETNELYKSFFNESDIYGDNELTFSDFKKMNEQQLLDIICILKDAPSCDSPCDSIEDLETSSESLSSYYNIGKGSKFSDDTINSSSDSLSSNDSVSKRKRLGIQFSIPPNSVNSKKLYRFFV